MTFEELMEKLGWGDRDLAYHLGVDLKTIRGTVERKHTPRNMLAPLIRLMQEKNFPAEDIVNVLYDLVRR